MCSSDFSLKLIAAACLLIIVTDSFVLQQILEKLEVIHLTSDPDVYTDCYKPQIRMRIIFTAYAILSASVCFVLTMALMCCDEFSEWFDKIVNGVADFMYIAFGPILFTFCLFGLYSIPELAHECHPTYVSSNLNLMDITILLICTGLSFCIVFIYALQHTNRIAEKELSDENSTFYQLFSTYLNRQRQKYHQEKKRRAASAQFDNSGAIGNYNNEASSQTVDGNIFDAEAIRELDMAQSEFSQESRPLNGSHSDRKSANDSVLYTASEAACDGINTSEAENSVTTGTKATSSHYTGL